ncbi:MAG TPA: hypothetical protein VGX37_05685 [Allosphingosinicella sp.]|jgi:hypothetical protein|nr:hypothetical protein [Allosphingosinicella sp.]
MADDSAPAAPMSAAAVSLRDTAKWLVGGVVVTAAGVFTGSSLTNFGSLEPATEPIRFTLAIVGAALGFAALAWILTAALAVLTLESVTFRMLAESETSTAAADEERRKLAATIARKYKHSFPMPANSLSELVAAIDGLPQDDPRRAAAVTFNALVMPDAGFLHVRTRFRRLTNVLIPATFIVALGFGLFAWAANPPDDAPAERPPLLVVNQPSP